jgi:hypothetical protein
MTHSYRELVIGGVLIAPLLSYATAANAVHTARKISSAEADEAKRSHLLRCN